MLSWILLIVVLAALVVLGTWFWGTVFGRGEVLEPIDDPDTLRADNRAAVSAGETEKVRFPLVTRGYRPELVDDVIAQLKDELEQARSAARTAPATQSSEKNV